MSNYIEYKGHKYFIDLKKTLEFVYGNPEKKFNYETAITQSYGYPTTIGIDDIRNSEMQLISKETTESKSSMSEVLANIRYDMVKYFLTMLSETQEDSEKFAIAFNTLYNEKIITEIE